jgi:uncharacterized protein (DUF305 family)
MTRSRIRVGAAALLAAVVVTGCRSAGGGAARTETQPAAAGRSDVSAAAATGGDSARARHTAADIRFMTDMIAHHAQAIIMARWAATHGASSSIRTLAGRVVNAQQDEIAIMQQWLRDRGLPVPEMRLDGIRVKMVVNGMEHEHRMPGMLTDEQMTQLDAARGAEFDRLFLTFMIQHHRGAVSMVKELIASPGAAQDDAVFKIASDINVDQTTEIDRMQKMLAAMLFEPRSR